jgi:protease-4
MKTFFITLAGVFVGLLLFFIAIPIFGLAAVSAVTSPEKTPSQAVLVLDLRSGLADQGAAAAILAGGAAPDSTTRIVLALRGAAADDRVKALFVRLPEGGMEPATADELAQAFARFRKSGKPILAHSQGFYASGVSVATYRLGAAANELWMQPGAPFEAVGVSMEDIFFKRFFDRFGVVADYEQRGPYKNAVNPYLYSDYTEAHREAQLSWMTAIFDHALNAAATDRGIKPDALRAAVVAGPYDAAQAQALGLITKTGQVEEAQIALLSRAGDEARLIDLKDYLSNEKPASTGGSGPIIAVVNAEGEIITGDGGGASPFGGDKVYSDAVARALYAAGGDDRVKAVVLRVSSPGGSDTASEQIAAAVRAVKKAGKPVVVSMGSYAASGGYWISADATSIVAEPSTITGSIGVYGGKFAFGDAAARYGVDVRELTVGGDFAAAGNMGHGWTPAQRAAQAAQIDRVYENFINHVATGRNLPVERVREIAGGHVWTGAQGKALGLVDELGGLTEAIDRAKALAKLDGPVKLKMLPEPPSPIETLRRALGVSTASAKTLAAASLVLGDRRVQGAADAMMREQVHADRLRAPLPLH